MPLPESVALKVGVVPTMELLLPSFSVMVTVEVVAPSATTGPEPVMVELAIEAAPGVKTTVPSLFTTGVAMERVFDSATVEAKVHVDSPADVLLEQTP